MKEAFCYFFQSSNLLFEDKHENLKFAVPYILGLWLNFWAASQIENNSPVGTLARQFML